MAVIGVRISWLILARNSLLVRLAFSALTSADCSDASIRLMFVMSSVNISNPPTVPLGVLPGRTSQRRQLVFGPARGAPDVAVAAFDLPCQAAEVNLLQRSGMFGNNS